MSYLGAIRFVLTTDGCSVSDVSIEPAKELRIEKLLCGKRVEGILTACDILQFDLAQRRRFTVMTQFAFVKRHFAHGIALLQQNRTPAE